MVSMNQTLLAFSWQNLSQLKQSYSAEIHDYDTWTLLKKFQIWARLI